MKSLNNLFLISFFCLLINSCAEESSIDIIEIPVQDAIPEGIAISDSNEIYLSNILSKNIIRTYGDGTNPIEINTRFTGQLSGVGATIHNNKLYQLGNAKTDSFYSVLQIINLYTLELESYFQLKDTTSTFFNDLAVSASGEVYITNTDQHSIVTVREGKLETLIVSEEIRYPNGITLSGDGNILYIASHSKGIRSYDLKTNTFLNEADPTTSTKGIDGLKWYNNALYGIQNTSEDHQEHRFVKFTLSENGSEIVKADTLVINHPKFNVPTTFDIKGGWIYILANSQLDNLDQERMEIKDPPALTNTYVLKMRVE